LKQRLDKILSNLGFGSRKEIGALIRSGRVTVDGKVCKSADEKVDPENQSLCFCGEEVEYRQYEYIMMNKPAGYLSATEDNRQKTVIELLPDRLQRIGLFPAGRLDRDSEGLLLLTNDGAAAHAIISPKKNIDKLYYVKYTGQLHPDTKEKFEAGIEIDGGEICLPAKIELIGEGEAEITVHEGKFHQVKRMISAAGGEVTYLKRLRIGEIKLDKNLEVGQIRRLSGAESEWIAQITEK